MQCVSAQCDIYSPLKKKLIQTPEVVEYFGVPPPKVIEVQSLMGDPTDGIPGVKVIEAFMHPSQPDTECDT